MPAMFLARPSATRRARPAKWRHLQWESVKIIPRDVLIHPIWVNDTDLRYERNTFVFLITPCWGEHILVKTGLLCPFTVGFLPPVAPGIVGPSHVGLQEHQTLGITKISETSGFQVSPILRNIRLPQTHICCHEKKSRTARHI